MKPFFEICIFRRLICINLPHFSLVPLVVQFANLFVQLTKEIPMARGKVATLLPTCCNPDDKKGPRITQLLPFSSEFVIK